MSAKIVNLNTYRKAKRKAEKKEKEDQNSARFGREKAEQRRREYEQDRVKAEIDCKQLDDDTSADK